MAAKPVNKLSDVKLQAMMEGMIADANSYDASDREGRRKLALAYQAGEMPDLVPGKDQSSVVSQDLADATAWLLPSLMRVFLASDRVGIYEPERPGDEGFADQATDFINFVLLRECDGESLLRDSFHDGLVLGNGIVKHWWDDTKEYKTETFTGLSDDAFVEIVSDDDVEVLEHSEKPDPSAMGAGVLGGGTGGLPVPPGPSQMAEVQGPSPQGSGIGGPSLVSDAPSVAAGQSVQNLAPVADPSALASPVAQPSMGAPQPDLAALIDTIPGLGDNFPPPPLLHDVKVRRVTRHGRLRVMAVPDEDFGIESAATGLNERECRFCYHRETPTRSELIERGYDKETVWELGSTNDTDDDERRRTWSSGTGVREDYEDKAGERVEVYECYALIDVDQDGVTEWHQIVMAGPSGSQKLLRQTEWGGLLPFTDIVPDPVPHVWRGRSLYDRLRDVQRVNTALTRRILDNLYMTVEPQRAVDLTRVENPDALFDTKLGGIIRTKGDPNNIIMDLAVPFVAKEAMPMIDEMRRVAERRVGVGEQSSGLDADALQGQVATAVAATQSASSLRKEDYARNIQVGLRRLFSCMLRLTVEHQERERTIRLRDEWVPIDPKSWNAEMDVSVNVGLGAGNRDRDVAVMQAVSAQIEKAIGFLGPDNPACNVETWFDAQRSTLEAAGIKSPERFFPVLTDEVKQQMLAAQAQKAQQPDPKVAAAQQKAQIDAAVAQQKLQGQQQISAAELQHKQALAEADLQANMRVREAEMAHRMELDRAKQEREMLSQQLKAQAGLQLEQAKADAKLQIESMKAEMDLRLRERELEIEAALRVRQQNAGLERGDNVEFPQ